MLIGFNPRLWLRPALLVPLCGLLAAARLQADYTVALQSEGLSTRTVRVGEEFDLDVWLDSDAQDQHWAAVLRLEFSSSGLQLVRCDWSSPFVTGGEDDVSVPGVAGLPARIRTDLVPDGPGVSNRVDVFLSNFTTAQQGYRIGRLVRMRLAVPPDYVGVDRIQVQVVPESFGDGFAIVPARAGEPFSLRIAPAEGQARASLSVKMEQGWISLEWPAAIQGAMLQTTTDLGGEWVDLAEVPQVVSGQNRVQLFTGTGGRPTLFRLRFP